MLKLIKVNGSAHMPNHVTAIVSVYCNANRGTLTGTVKCIYNF